MKKKFSFLGILLAGILCLTGCSNILNGGSIETSSQTKGNCTAIECIKKINPENTVEQINNIIGFEGELIDEKYEKYYWELSENTGVEVTYYGNPNGTITIDYDKDSLVNKSVDFSRYNELKSKINDGITYDNFISYIGNVEGTIIEKSINSVRYIWVSSNGDYLKGTFSKSTGYCTVIIGLIK